MKKIDCTRQIEFLENQFNERYDSIKKRLERTMPAQEYGSKATSLYMYQSRPQIISDLVSKDEMIKRTRHEIRRLGNLLCPDMQVRCINPEEVMTIAKNTGARLITIYPGQNWQFEIGSAYDEYSSQVIKDSENIDKDKCVKAAYFELFREQETDETELLNTFLRGCVAHKDLGRLFKIGGATLLSVIADKEPGRFNHLYALKLE